MSIVDRQSIGFDKFHAPVRVRYLSEEYLGALQCTQ